jgi:flagellar motor switch protein FliG
MSVDIGTVSGTRKAAILLVSVGQERAAQVLRTMRESEVTEIMAEIARLTDIEADDIDAVHEDFTLGAQARKFISQGGVEFARAVLEASVGEDKASEIFDRLSYAFTSAPFEFLRNADPRQILSFIQDEHPQTIALVLAYMNPDEASLILGGLPEETQRDVAVRLATMDRTSPDIIATVETALERRLSTVLQQSDMSAVGGIQSLVDLLNRSDRATERLIFEGLEDHNEELADEVRSRMFVFEDIVTLDDKSVQLILRQVDSKDLAMALKGVRPEVRRKIMDNMSSRAGENLMEEIEMLGAVRLKAVEEAQGAVVRVIRALEEAGQIVLTRTGDEYID